MNNLAKQRQEAFMDYLFKENETGFGEYCSNKIVELEKKKSKK